MKKHFFRSKGFITLICTLLVVCTMFTGTALAETEAESQTKEITQTTEELIITPENISKHKEAFMDGNEASIHIAPGDYSEAETLVFYKKTVTLCRRI